MPLMPPAPLVFHEIHTETPPPQKSHLRTVVSECDVTHALPPIINWTISTPKEDCGMNALRVSLACSVMGMTAAAALDSSVPVNTDVLPILQKSCQRCDRPGEIAPMSFLTYG